MVEQSGSERADLLERQLRDTHLEVRQLHREIREAHQLIQTLFSTRDIHHRRLISLEHRLGLRLVPRLPRNRISPLATRNMSAFKQVSSGCSGYRRKRS